MGIADLIPGVSGGTIALVCGIYEELLESIKSLQLHSLRSIAWRFLGPVGAGVATAVLFVSRLLYLVLVHFPVPLFAFVFGVIVASALACAPKAELKRASRWPLLIVGFVVAFLLSGGSSWHLFGLSFMGLVGAGTCAGCAMLLPGISGSYLLQIFGIYPFALAALSAPSAPGSFSLLLAIGMGAALGVILFSRVVSFLLSSFSSWTYAILVGFMLGGTRAIWPFGGQGWGIAVGFALLGFLLVMLLEVRMKKLRPLTRV